MEEKNNDWTLDGLVSRLGLRMGGHEKIRDLKLLVGPEGASRILVTANHMQIVASTMTSNGYLFQKEFENISVPRDVWDVYLNEDIFPESMIKVDVELSKKEAENLWGQAENALKNILKALEKEPKEIERVNQVLKGQGVLNAMKWISSATRKDKYQPESKENTEIYYTLDTGDGRDEPHRMVLEGRGELTETVKNRLLRSRFFPKDVEKLDLGCFVCDEPNKSFRIKDITLTATNESPDYEDHVGTFLDNLSELSRNGWLEPENI